MNSSTRVEWAKKSVISSKHSKLMITRRAITVVEGTSHACRMQKPRPWITGNPNHPRRFISKNQSIPAARERALRHNARPSTAPSLYYHPRDRLFLAKIPGADMPARPHTRGWLSRHAGAFRLPAGSRAKWPIARTRRSPGTRATPFSSSFNVALRPPRRDRRIADSPTPSSEWRAAAERKSGNDSAPEPGV